MLTDDLEAPDEVTPEALRRRYAADLAEAVASIGRERVLDGTGIDPATLDAIGSGEAVDVPLEDAAAILALREDREADAILAEVRDHLLLGLSSAMLDVETVASEVDADLDPKEIQAKIEGRFPMTLDEYAVLHRFVAART